MSHFKHLVLEDRITIQSDLHDGLSFKKIASHINHDCTTVSSEIRNHLTVIDDMWPTNRKHNRCIHYGDCKKRHVCNFCQSIKNNLCKYCDQVTCSKCCPDYKEKVCDRLSKAPYVCNGCDSTRRCPLQKKFYDAKEAQLDYERTLSDSRSGVMITDDELSELDNLISPLIKKGSLFITLPLIILIKSTGPVKLFIRTSIKDCCRPNQLICLELFVESLKRINLLIIK